MQPQFNPAGVQEPTYPTLSERYSEMVATDPQERERQYAELEARKQKRLQQFDQIRRFPDLAAHILGINAQLLHPSSSSSTSGGSGSGAASLHGLRAIKKRAVNPNHQTHPGVFSLSPEEKERRSMSAIYQEQLNRSPNSAVTSLRFPHVRHSYDSIRYNSIPSTFLRPSFPLTHACTSLV